MVPAINQGVPKCQIPRRSSCFKKSSDRVGQLRKLPGSNSLFSVGQDSARLYLRYSKKHAQGGTYFGLRETDLRQLVGHNGFICFFFDDTTQPLFVPYADFEEIFHSAVAASDGQYKVRIICGNKTHELYVPRRGRFNLDGFAGLETFVHSVNPQLIQHLAHPFRHTGPACGDRSCKRF